MNAGTPRTGLRRSPHTLLAVLIAIALFLTMGLAGSALADESSTVESATESSQQQDPPAADPPPADPPGQSTVSEVPAAPAASSAVPSSGVPSSPAPSSAASSTAAQPSGQPGDQQEDADELNGLGPTEGVLAVRVINSVDGSEVVNVGARISKPHDSRFTRLPASMVLEAGEYYVEVMDVPNGYSSVAPMSRTATVVAKKRLTITLVATPVSGPTQSNHPHPVTPTVRPERIPIKSIPSGRTS